MIAPSVEAEDGTERLFGTLVSDMQDDVAVGDNSITGELKYIPGGLAESGPLAGSGYFLALAWDWTDDTLTSLKVGLSPSQGTGLVEAIDDPDKNGVFKITDNSRQIFVVEYSNGTKTERLGYSLGAMTLTVDLEGMTKAQLLVYCEENDIAANNSMTKSEIIAAIEAA